MACDAAGAIVEGRDLPGGPPAVGRRRRGWLFQSRPSFRFVISRILQAMESVATRSAAPGARMLRRVDPTAISVWALAGATVLYLGIDGGGYDIVIRSQVGSIVWWVVLIGAAWGLLPVARLSRAGWWALALLGAFVVWTALASTWSESSERSLQDLSLVAGYLGVLLLGTTVHRDRARAVRHTVGAVGSAVVAVALLALISRLRPDLFPAAHQTSAFLRGDAGRLSWPLNYWNALAALLALGLPLLFAIATSARTLAVQAAAAAGVPVLALCGYLTFSRGGAIAGAVAVTVFIALAPERIPKLVTALATSAGSAVLVIGSIHRSAIEHGLTNGAARHEGATLLVAVVLVCVAVAAIQVGIGLAVRRGTLPRVLALPVHRARLLLGVGAVVCVVAALLAGVPTSLSHAWRDFKHPAAVLRQDSIARFGSASGNGRYDYWRVAVDATTGHRLLTGNGPGTFQLVWLPRAPYESYVENAHSLYVETLSDVGIIGLALLVGFLVVVLASAVRMVVRSRREARAEAAGLTAALAAFCVSATFDWIWQVPVLPAAFLLLAAAALAPSLPQRVLSRRAYRVMRLGIGAIAIACLIAIVIPLATTNLVRRSEAASARGDQTLALSDARAAARIESGAASPQIQEALVLELEGQPLAALIPARRAAADEPANWSTWLIISRLEAESGQRQRARTAFIRARSLNPKSPVFHQ
jgi:O-antigen ligase